MNSSKMLPASVSIHQSQGFPTPPNALRVECTTWSRDSHGLFDYEARHMNVKHFLVSRAARLFRIGADVDCIPEAAPAPVAVANVPVAQTNATGGNENSPDQQRAETPQATDFLLSIKCSRDGKYVVIPADRNSSGLSAATVMPQKLWSIVREQNDNKHILQENDIIKLGRYKLRVKQLVAHSTKRPDDSSVTADIPDLRLDDGEPPLSFIAPNDMQCRICLLEGNQDGDPLISPCDCKGSIKFVHLACLRHWINGRLNFTEQQQKPIFVKQLLCELCKIPYPTAISYNNERLEVVTVPKTEPPFILLENMVGNHQKGVHVISMSSKKDLKLGRGHESDVRIPDVSISRYHATIRFVDGNFQLEDHNSKFGTLVSLRKAFSVGDSVAALQVGRSVVKLYIDSTPVIGEAIVDISEVTPPISHHLTESQEHLSEEPAAVDDSVQQQQRQLYTTGVHPDNYSQQSAIVAPQAIEEGQDLRQLYEQDQSAQMMLLRDRHLFETPSAGDLYPGGSREGGSGVSVQHLSAFGVSLQGSEDRFISNLLESGVWSGAAGDRLLPQYRSLIQSGVSLPHLSDVSDSHISHERVVAQQMEIEVPEDGIQPDTSLQELAANL